MQKTFKQLNKLTAINKEPILTPDLKMGLMSIAEHNPDDIPRIVGLLKNGSWETPMDALYSLPIYNNARYNRDIEYELYLKKVLPSESAPKCPRCGSTSVKTESIQLSAADEAPTIVNRCVCGKVFGGAAQL